MQDQRPVKAALAAATAVYPIQISSTRSRTAILLKIAHCWRSYSPRRLAPRCIHLRPESCFPALARLPQTAAMMETELMTTKIVHLAATALRIRTATAGTIMLWSMASSSFQSGSVPQCTPIQLNSINVCNCNSINIDVLEPGTAQRSSINKRL